MSRTDELEEMVALENCPFCGEAPYVSPRVKTYGPRISCRNADCRLGNITASFSVDDWNKRQKKL